MTSYVCARSPRRMPRSVLSGVRALSSPPVSAGGEGPEAFCVVAVEHRDLRSSWN
ncbi:hypothetical protein SAMN04489731_11655 [Amycolatopsis regifaucium]|nr:hypothetical protein SAMN04489731_11655 [Amycolatopsis regifaucium]